MNSVATYQISTFIKELRAFSFSDILVNIPKTSKTVIELKQFENEYEFEKTAVLNQLYKTAKQEQAIADVNPLCLANHVIKWSHKDQTIVSPLFLYPTQLNYNKVIAKYQLKLEEDFFINPFVIDKLRQDYDIILEQNHVSVEESIAYIKSLLIENQLKFEIINQYFFSSFHYHRFVLLKDLEEIEENNSYSDSLNQLLGNAFTTNSFELDNANLFLSDIDQIQVLKKLQNENILLQGPPGTGKSHVISNLFGKLLLHKDTFGLLCEKTTALNIIFDKLKQKNLHYFIGTIDNKQSSKEFLTSLKQTWEFLSNYKATSKKVFCVFEEKKQYLQGILERLQKIKLLEHYSLSELQTITKKNNPKLTSLAFETLNQYKTVLQRLDASTIPFSILGKLKNELYSHVDFANRIQAFIRDFKQLSEVFQIDSYEEIKNLSIQVNINQIIENEKDKPYKDIFVLKSKQKSFLQLKKRYSKIHREEKLFDEFKAIWISFPSQVELKNWITLQNKNSWVSNLKLKKQLKSYLKSESYVITDVLNELKNYFLFKTKKLKLEEELIELGIEHPEHELSGIKYVLNQLNQLHFSDNKLNYDQIVLKQHASSIRNVVHFIHINTNFELNDNINNWSLNFQENDSAIISLCQDLSNIPNSILNSISIFNDLNELEEAIIRQEFLKLLQQFPETCQLNNEKIQNILVDLLKESNLSSEQLIDQIHQTKIKQFEHFHSLMLEQSNKLNDNDKNLKKKLKNGKKILVKEFAKSRQNLSIRNLLASDAALWIKLLHPILLCTSNGLSKHIPLEKNFFKLLVFDEASQIPLAKTIPGLFRTERTLIAGDSKQMSPSSFFSSKDIGVDLLHHANYYLSTSFLSHHYRSKNNALIAFSNKYFYDNKLKVFPDYTNKNAGIFHHYVENGVFENRKNVKEAKDVAAFIEKIINTDKSIGVVAFSQQQIIEIQKQINPVYAPVISKKIEENKLFFKSLEQVQGEECDILLISLAYGKDKDGVFNLRFGPINQENGIKRLNVLLTRAIEDMHLFTSVLGEDFKISSNENVELLKKCLLYFQQDKEQKKEIQSNEIILKNIQKHFPSVEELLTFHNIMKNRNWKIIYDI